MSKVVEVEQESMEATHHPEGVSLKALLLDYRQWIQGRGFTKRSPMDHVWKLSLFWRFLEGKGLLHGDRVQLLDIDRDVIADYQAFVFDYISPATGKTLSCNSQINALSYLITFFRFLEKNHHLAVNPTDFIKLPRHPHLLPAVLLKPEEMRRLLAVPDVKTVMGFRDRTILEVLWTSAPRLSELCSLAVDDLNFNEGLLTISEGKGNTQRVVPLGEGAAAWLQEYLRAVRPILARKTGDRHYLFLNRCGQKLGISGWEYKINVYVRRAGIKRGFTSHGFRHQLASDMLKNGADLRHIQQMLGHEDLQTTLRYLHVVKVELARVHAQTHPKERMAPVPVAYSGTSDED